MAMPYGAADPAERLELLDAEGIEVAILYPSLNLMWQSVVEDAGLALALARAYNRFVEDFCRDSGGRLVPIAQLLLDDVEGSVKEFDRAVQAGAKGGMLVNFALTRKPIGHPDHYPLFQKAVELDVPSRCTPRSSPAGLPCSRASRTWAASRP